MQRRHFKREGFRQHFDQFLAVEAQNQKEDTKEVWSCSQGSQVGGAEVRKAQDCESRRSEGEGPRDKVGAREGGREQGWLYIAARPGHRSTEPGSPDSTLCARTASSLNPVFAILPVFSPSSIVPYSSSLSMIHHSLFNFFPHGGDTEFSGVPFDIHGLS